MLESYDIDDVKTVIQTDIITLSIVMPIIQASYQRAVGAYLYTEAKLSFVLEPFSIK